jgi:hypothetical protein
MTLGYYNFLSDNSVELVKNKLYLSNELIEISAIETCLKTINLDFKNNINTINNNNILIYQDIVDPLLNTVEINNENFNIIKIAWKRSKLAWNGKAVGLEFHIVLNNYKSIKNTTIIIPLDLYNSDKLNITSSNDVPSVFSPFIETKVNQSQNAFALNKKSYQTNEYNIINPGKCKNNKCYDNTQTINSTNNDIEVIDVNDKLYHSEGFKNLFYNKKLSDDFDGLTAQIDNIDIDINIDNSVVEKDIIKKNYFNLNNTFANTKNSFPDINSQMLSENSYNHEKNKFNLKITYKKSFDVNKITLNNLLYNTNQIPLYQCCSDSIGPIMLFNLSNLQLIFKNITLFYILYSESGEKYYITDPHPFSEDIGLYIRHSITDDNLIRYVKKFI